MPPDQSVKYLFLSYCYDIPKSIDPDESATFAIFSGFFFLSAGKFGIIGCEARFCRAAI